MLPRTPPATAARDTSSMTPRGTLLIVDDEAGPRESLTMVFKDQYNVITAASGRDAIQIVGEQRVDVAILDILMGDMSGTEVLREIKLIDPKIEAVMLTGYESLTTARAAVKYGAADYISKPFDVLPMREVIAKCFERRRMAVETDFSLQELQATAKELEAEISDKDKKLAAAATVAAKRAAQDNSEEGFVHWRDYGLILLERKWITITTLVAIVAGALIWNFKTTPIFRAITRIQAEAENVKVLNIQDVVSTDTRDDQYLNTQIKILQSRTLAEQVVKSLALDKNRDFIPDAPPHTDFAEALQRSIAVQLVRDSRLIDISAEHPNPEMAQLLANGVANEFIKQNLDRKMSASLDAVRWLRQQADEYKVKVDKSEAAIQAYRERTGSVSLEEHQNIIVEKLKELSSAVTKARTDALMAEIEWNKVKAFLDGGENLLSLPSIAGNLQVSALRQQLNDKQIAISVLRERYKDKHPTMISAMTESKEIQDKIASASNEAAEAIKANYLMAKSRDENLQQALKEQEKTAIDLSNKMVEYTALKRNAEADKQLYESILTRMKEAGIAGKLDINTIRVVDPAQTPKYAYKPRKLRNLLLATVLGMLCGIGLSFAAHFYDDKIKTFDDVESFLSLPLLSSVPGIDMKDEFERSRVSHIEPHSLASEAFRNLRASISLSSNKDATPLLITSTAPGEGKSLVASNLAIVFAHNNQRTLLIDADMRRPVQHRVFKIDTQQGLSRFLVGSDSFEEVIQPTEVPNLDIMVVGTVPPNPPELLGSSRMHELLAMAAERYDRIVIDTPPITAVSDPLLLLPHAEGVVFVVHFGKIRREIVARAVRKLRDSGATLAGAVMNNISIEKHGYHYYPYRYSHYYRHHTENEEKPAEVSHS